jgi:universal stress protein F
MPDKPRPIKPEIARRRPALLEMPPDWPQCGAALPEPAVSRGVKGLQGQENSMFSKILVAVDLTDPGADPKGIAQAVELANSSGGIVRLVNIQPLLPATFMEYVPADFDAEQEKRAASALQAVVATIKLPAERLSGTVRVGGIYHEILAEAADWGADLIVVGSHRPVVSDYLLGSNAKTIVRHALCSVLVVRP